MRHGQRVVEPAHAAGKQAEPLVAAVLLALLEQDLHADADAEQRRPGRVRRFDDSLTVPHMGWNTLRARRAHPLLDGVADGSHVYFVHSYYCDAAEDVVIATSDYGQDFAAIVGRGPVLGLQFHPEKSQAVGQKLVANFVAGVAARRAA